MENSGHWDAVYLAKADEELSWFEARPETSLRLLATWASREFPVLDVGGGRSGLAQGLLKNQFSDVLVVDLSKEALGVVNAQMPNGGHVIVGDVLEVELPHNLGAWHDRAVFHFFVDPGQQERYVQRAGDSVRPGGVVVLGCFGPEGPSSCSGLPVARHSAPELEERFGESFELVTSELVDHRTPSGVTQQFCWVVLRRR